MRPYEKLLPKLAGLSEIAKWPRIEDFVWLLPRNPAKVHKKSLRMSRFHPYLSSLTGVDSTGGHCAGNRKAAIAFEVPFPH